MRILIAILGCHKRLIFRRAQRETWLQDASGSTIRTQDGQSIDRVDYRYFLGQPAIDPPEADVVYLDCLDTYEKLVSKTHAMIRWALERDYDFVFKCDDDTYVRVDKLLSSNFAQDDYSGFSGGRWGEVSSGNRQIVYGYAQGGAGYWLSRRAMEIVAEHMLVKEYCEDCAVGKTLALHDINPVHDARYQPQVDRRALDYPEVRAGFITLHKINPDQMRHLHRSYAKQRERECVSA